MSISYLEYERKGAKFRVDLKSGDAYRIDRSKLSAAGLSDDPTVSLRHAILQCVDGDHFYITDLNSRNGTMVNGRPISVPTLLQNEDVIRIGTCELTFHQDASAVREADATDAWSTRLLVSRKLITVLVTDIKGYTGLTLQLGEAAIGEILSSLFKDAGVVLSSNLSWGQKYIGDAVMGVWIHEGELPTPDEFALVLRSLMGIRHIFTEINQRIKLPEPITFGSGINTGYAALGNMGSRHAPDYTALGDSVNKTFRLESATRDLNVDVVLGSLTYDLLCAVSDKHIGLSSQSIHLKGYPEPEEVYTADFASIEQILRLLQPITQRTASAAAPETTGKV